MPHKTELVGDAEKPFCNELANEISAAIIKATTDGVLSLEVALCVVVAVAADYARADFGNGYLEDLAAVVRDRVNHPLPSLTPTENR